MVCACLSLFLSLACVQAGLAVVDSTPAWNGQLLPGAIPDSNEPAPFLPYYVANGDRSVDDTSSTITYSSDFHSFTSPYTVNKSFHASNATSATAKLSFAGPRVEWFGITSPESGIASVYVDGTFKQNVDAYSADTLYQQRLFIIEGLSAGPHTLSITNSARKNNASRGNLITVDAFLVASFSTDSEIRERDNQAPLSSKWSLVQMGTTGVAAMQLSVVTDYEVMIVDKVEHNPLTVNGHPAWGEIYDLRTHQSRPLDIHSNSFCAGGTWLSNGTLLNIGGNPVVVDKTGSADFGDVNGLQAIRMFNPCDDGNCDMMESPDRIRMASARWYNSATRLDDGSVMIIGGSIKGGWINNASTNNPTIEYFPPKNLHGQNGLPITLSFLKNTLNSNLFPIAFTLPDGRIFMAANRDAMIYDWRSNTETSLPQIPNSVRVTYPMTGTGLLLPLSPSNNYQAEILLCGGSTIDDSRAGYDISSQEAASSQCSRIILTEDGIKAGWSTEDMPNARIMPDAVLLPDGNIVIVNGGGSGIAGYGNVKDRVGESNAANPVFTPTLYIPTAEAGHRFDSSMMPTSEIPRLYHSVASLTPNGSVMIAGSNPNLDRSNVEYQTEYRVEWLLPPYMSMDRPKFGGAPTSIDFGKSFNLQTSDVSGAKDIKVSLVDLGFVTHGVNMNSRLVYLTATISSSKSISITGPPNASVYPPGPGWLYLVVDGVPSAGKKVVVGGGEGPPVDEGAIQNLLSQTKAEATSDDTKNTERRRSRTTLPISGV